MNTTQYDTFIRRAVHDFPVVPMYMVKAVIAVESGFNPKAYREEKKISDASRGLMQLLLQTARALGFGGTAEDLFSPGANIWYGTKLLSQNIGRTGSWPAALSAYNGGFRPHLGFGEVVKRPGVRCMGRVVPVGEFCNQSYVDKVLKRAVEYASKEGVSENALPFPIPKPRLSAGPTGPLPLLAILFGVGWFAFGGK